MPLRAFPEPLEQWLSEQVVESFLLVEVSVIREEEMRQRLDHAVSTIEHRDQRIEDLEQALAASLADNVRIEQAMTARINEAENERQLFANALEVVQGANQRYRATSMAMVTRRLPATFLPTLDRIRRRNLEEIRGRNRLRRVLRLRDQYQNRQLQVDGILNEDAFEIVEDNELDTSDEEAFAMLA